MERIRNRTRTTAGCLFLSDMTGPVASAHASVRCVSHIELHRLPWASEPATYSLMRPRPWRRSALEREQARKWQKPCSARVWAGLTRLDSVYRRCLGAVHWHRHCAPVAWRWCMAIPQRNLQRLGETAVENLERQDWLEPLADPLQRAVVAAFQAAGETGRRVRDFLHGTWLGHPLHPVLTDVPL
jgi:hypothetical protein